MMLFLDLLDDDETKNKFVKTYLLYENLMYHIAYDILHDSHLSEDAVQEAFLRIAKRIDMVDEPNSKRTKNLMCLIVKRTAIDIYNKEKNASVVYLEDYEEISFKHFEWAKLQKEETLRLSNALTSLPKIYADIMVLYYLYNYSQEEVASILDLKPFTVRKRIERAKILLKKSLDLND